MPRSWKSGISRILPVGRRTCGKWFPKPRPLRMSACLGNRSFRIRNRFLRRERSFRKWSSNWGYVLPCGEKWRISAWKTRPPGPDDKVETEGSYLFFQGRGRTFGRLVLSSPLVPFRSIRARKTAPVKGRFLLRKEVDLFGKPERSTH